MAEYPEHDKLDKIKDKSQSIGEFVEWMRYTHNAYFCTEHEHTESCSSEEDVFDSCGFADGALVTVRAPITKLLAEFFEIDQDKIYAEKEQMLDEIRTVNAGL